MEDHEQRLERLLEMRAQRFAAEQRKKLNPPFLIRLKWRTLLRSLNMRYGFRDWLRVRIGRSFDSIGAEIATIPQPLVRITRYDPEKAPPPNCAILLCAHVFRTRKPESSIHVRGGMEPGSVAYSALREIYSQSKGFDKGTRISVSAATDGNIPFRSAVFSRERQNYQMPREEDIDGRHFQLDIKLSTPLHHAFFQELLDPKIQNGIGATLSSMLLCVPLDRDYPARPLAIGAPEPMESTRKVRLRQLLLVGYSGEVGMERITSITFFEESD